MALVTYLVFSEAIKMFSFSFQPADHSPVVSGSLILQVSKMNNLSRSKSLGALTLISTDTLPTYITDAVRQRCVAIR